MLPEEKTGETTGAADLTTGVKANVAGSQQTGTVIPDAGEPKDVEGLKTAAIEERKKRQVAEDRATQSEEQTRLYQEQLALINANRPTPEAPKDGFAEFGLEEGDYPTVGQLRQVQAAKSQQDQAASEVRSFISQNPDFKDFVGSFGPAGLQASPKLNEAIQNDPGLVQRCNTPLGLIHAYNAVKLRETQKLMQENKNKTLLEEQELEDQVKNAERVGSASSVGGAGATGGKVDCTKMSKEEFDKYDAEQARKYGLSG